MMRWLGTSMQIAGAVLVASNTVNPYWGYVTMLPGAAIWVALALIGRDFALATMQAVFCVINFTGVWRWGA